MKNYIKVTTFLVITAIAQSCAIAPPLSPQQRRSLQTRTFESASYETVFRAFKTVLQDDGYIIKNQDLNGGLIVATIEKEDRSSGYLLLGAGAQNRNYRTGEGYEVSVNLEKVNDKITESRITIQKLDTYSQGGKTGSEILEPETYRSFYTKVQTEVERRKAQGKG